MKQIQPACVPGSVANAPGNSAVFTGEGHWIAPLNNWGVSAWFRIEQAAKFGGGELVADTFVDGCKRRSARAEYPALLECHRAKSVEAHKAGVQRVTVCGVFAGGHVGVRMWFGGLNL